MDEFDHRFSAAKKARSGRLEDDGFEVYKFCFNGRENEWVGGKKTREPEEIFADVVATVAEDFYGDLFHTMTPENADWVAYETGTAIPEDFESQMVELIKEREVAIAKAIRASNYYDEGPTAFQDAVLGNVGIWSDRYSLNDPITFEAVPASETYLRLGPRGIDDRFRVKKYFARDLEQLLPGAKFPREIADKIKKGTSQCEIIWGFWTDFTDPGNPQWYRAIRVDKKSVGLDRIIGPPGSCPFIVGRFNAEPNSPWARGPARRMLPTLRTLDELVRMNLESMDHTLDPSIIYPHDGMLDLSDGLEPGIGYPSMPGSADSVREIGGGDLNYGFFAKEQIVEDVRDGFYRDMPQRGKTPPSASQYMGEEQKQVRRMARPAGKLWKEFGVGLLKRVEWLETQPGGSLQDENFQLLEGQVVTLRPISPLERAQAREEVLVAQSIMGMAVEALGPEQTALVIDGPKTMTNIKEKLSDKLVEFRTEDQIKAIMEAQRPQEQPNGQA